MICLLDFIDIHKTPTDDDKMFMIPCKAVRLRPNIKDPKDEWKRVTASHEGIRAVRHDIAEIKMKCSEKVRGKLFC